MKGAKGNLKKLIQDVQSLEIPVHAANACYFLVLSLFPTLVLFLGLLRYTSLDPADLMGFMEGFLPAALQPYAWELISSTYANTSRTVLSVSALTALWSAGRGVYGLMKGLNAVYGVEEKRGWLRTRCLCAAYMVLFILTLLLTLVLHVFGNTLVDFLYSRGFLFSFLTDVVDLRFFLLVALQTMLFCAMLSKLPSEDNGFLETLPGALFGSLGWMTVSSLFSVYVRYASRYSNIFGSVYMLALTLLWLYLCVSIVFYGGVLNRILKEFGK